MEEHAETLESLKAQLLLEREKARDAQAQLAGFARMAMLGEIVTVIPHDLLNLLSPVVGYSDLLSMKRDLPEKTMTFILRIQDAANKSVKLLRNLSDFNDAGGGAAGGTDIPATIQAVVSLLEYNLGRKKVALVIDLEAGLPQVHCNSVELRQVLAALMINAKLAMQPNGGELRVSAHRENGGVRVCVSDRGAHAAGGESGAYLAICSQILSSRGCGLETSVKAGEGTSHGFTLPIAECVAGETAQ